MEMIFIMGLTFAFFMTALAFIFEKIEAEKTRAKRKTINLNLL